MVMVVNKSGLVSPVWWEGSCPPSVPPVLLPALSPAVFAGLAPVGGCRWSRYGEMFIGSAGDSVVSEAEALWSIKSLRYGGFELDLSFFSILRFSKVFPKFFLSRMWCQQLLCSSYSRGVNLPGGPSSLCPSSFRTSGIPLSSPFWTSICSLRRPQFESLRPSLGKGWGTNSTPEGIIRYLHRLLEFPG